jgi:hypothetical protein
MKKIIPIIIALVIIGGGAFYGGMKYGQGKSPLGQFSRQNFQDMSQEERQQLFQGNIGEDIQGEAGRGIGADFLTGEVIDKDEQSLTLKMLGGSSKIVFFSDSTEISKTAEGSMNDIEVGKQIMVSGEQNSDGSYTAKTIQLSPR